MQTFREKPDPLEGHTIGACLDEHGKPIYFHVPEDATDHQVASMAFQARHDRQPSTTEWHMLSMIERHRGPYV